MDNRGMGILEILMVIVTLAVLVMAILSRLYVIAGVVMLIIAAWIAAVLFLK